MQNRTRTLTSTILIVAAFTIGNVINGWLPDLEVIMIRPFTTTATVNTAADRAVQQVQVRSGRVTLQSAHLAEAVSYRGEVLTTPGRFVVAQVRLEASGETTGIGNFVVRGGNGQVFGGQQRGSYQPQCISTQPGIPLTCTLFIEVTPEAVSGARLEFTNHNSVSGDELAVFDLGEMALLPGPPPNVGGREFGGA